MAGTAYVREMYQLYGAPAFLAAYNAGPRRLEDYLWGNRGLPEETRNYVARIGPRIQGTHPNRRAPEEVYAAAEIPLNIPAGPRRGDAATMLALREQRRAVEPTTAIASAAPSTSWGAPARTASVVAMAPVSSPGDPGTTITRMEPVTSPGDPGHSGGVTMMARMDPVASPGDPGVAERAPVAVAAAPAPRSFSLIGTAHAGSLPVQPRAAVQAFAQPAVTPGNWGVQVGAFASENLARAAAGRAKDMVGGPARATTERVAQGREVLFRARVTGLSSRGAAEQACDRLRARGACMVVAPGV
jgi:cell division septation protein DedD